MWKRREYELSENFSPLNGNGDIWKLFFCNFTHHFRNNKIVHCTLIAEIWESSKTNKKEVRWGEKHKWSGDAAGLVKLLKRNQ